MTITNTTVANRIIANLMSGDGCTHKTRLGVKVNDLCKRIATSRRRDSVGNVYGYTFADGSEIESHGGGWDTPEGWASQDAG